MPAKKKTRKPNTIYYIRKNDTAATPSHLMFLDCETKAVAQSDGEQLHKAYMAWTWQVRLGKQAEILRSRWEFWDDMPALCAYIITQVKTKSALYLLGSNITFDLWATGFIAHLDGIGWECEQLYDKGLVTMIIVHAPTEAGKKPSRRLKVLAVQNFLQGSVASWGDLVGKPKLDIDLQDSTYEEQKTYCHRDTEITGLVFLDYLRFLVHHDMGGFANTISSQSFRCFRHRFLQEKILHYDQPEINRFSRAGYYGGRVECRRLGPVPGGPFVKLDVNSLYPAVMRDGTYPVALKQWKRSHADRSLESRMENGCCLAEVTVRTPVPAYPLRHGGKLCFPTGEFTTILSSDSLRYAFAQGHIHKVNQYLYFTAAPLFSDFVDTFYPLKAKYKAEGNEVWEKTVKLVLNSLYGKFGEKRALEVVKGPDPERDFMRGNCVIDIPTLQEKFPWTLTAEFQQQLPYVLAQEWSFLGTYCLSADVPGREEGPMSMVPIAAHVTDQARMLLWRYMELVGIDNVLYCDTDSLIIEQQHLHRLEEVLHDTQLGALKVEGVADSLELRGLKDYTFGQEKKTKGLSARAVQDKEGFWQQAQFLGVDSLLRGGYRDGFPIRQVKKKFTAAYDKGTVSPTGVVQPFVFPLEA